VVTRKYPQQDSPIFLLSQNLYCTKSRNLGTNPNFNPELLGIILLTISLLINFALRLIQKRGNVGSKG
jgi:hypothetical protein